MRLMIPCACGELEFDSVEWDRITWVWTPKNEKIHHLKSCSYIDLWDESYDVDLPTQRKDSGDGL
jgi:hypothetical protein